MNLKLLLSALECRFSGEDAQISLVTHRLGEVTDGALFVCINGNHADGHDFAHLALQKGARAVVCERGLGLENEILVENSRKALSLLSAAFYGHPSERLTLIGVTGTNGKTTTACRIRSILTQADRKTMLIGTLGADSGNGYEQTDYTTPDAVVFNRKLAEGVQAGCECAVAEVSSQALSQNRCDCLGFDIAVFTNLSEEHLDYHGSMEAYAQAKATLFDTAKTAVVNADDAYAPLIMSHCKGRVITFSLHDQADLTAKNIRFEPDGVSYILVSREGIERIRLNTHGVIAVYNSMAAVGAAVAAGVDFSDACRFANIPVPVEGRMQKISADEPFSVYVDYAHTPAALYETLYALRQITGGRLIVVFGCGGDRDRAKRPQMGEIASALADVTVLTSDNPRSEDPLQIINEIAAGFKSKKELILCADRRTAIGTAIGKAQNGDCVLIAGKGHEKTQQTAGLTLAFDDVRVAQSFF